MQATIASPSTSLGNAYFQNVHHSLNRDLMITPFEDVAKTISNKINNMKRLDETTQPFDPHQQSPQIYGMCLYPNSSPLPTNPKIIQQYRSKFSYCQKYGHWYISCIQYERDSKEKQMLLRCIPREFQQSEPP
ncbi:hypothetical protein O181_030238 [Austropuccinia psidii MF-1]|uniref:Uncharacterized protein n=1 Tax=Austropuccinia psidii MF-1 TaxID=1389203 RepID=A0A9Q3H3H9_9BASI|nr:hypothetical protein [Austropuccinia psidii MF-1]